MVGSSAPPPEHGTLAGDGATADRGSFMVRENPAHPACAGPVNRRGFARLGLGGLGGLPLPGLFRLQADSASSRRDTALLVVWLHGGASHLETYDPKPLAPSEYRGPYRPINTRVHGMQ